MKNSLITYLLGFFFLITCYKAMGSSWPKNDSSACLEIDGVIVNAASGDQNTCTIELICSNTVIETVVLKEGKKRFKFTLNKNNEYSIRISRKGYITKLVGVDTHMPGDPSELYGFSFETKLLEESGSEKLNKEYPDVPIALIYFDHRKDCFQHNKIYTSKIKKEIALK